MNKINVTPNVPRRSYTSFNAAETMRKVDAHGVDIEKLAEAVNWLIDQVVSTKLPASTSVDAKTNRMNAIAEVVAPSKDK